MTRQPAPTKTAPTAIARPQTSLSGNGRAAPPTPGHALQPIATALSVWSGLYVVPHVYWAVGGDAGFSALKPSATAHPDWQAINAVASVILLVPVAIGLLLPRSSSHRRTRTLLLAACLAGASIAASHGIYGVVYRFLNLTGAVDIDGQQFTPAEHTWVIWDLYFFEPWFLIEGVLFASAGWAAIASARAQRRWLFACSVGTSLALASGVVGLRIG